MKKNSGIGLVVLSITVVVISILIAVVLSIVLGDNGVIPKIKKSSKTSEVKVTLDVSKDLYDQLRIEPKITGYKGEKKLDKLHYTYYLKEMNENDFKIVRQEIGATYYSDVPETGTGTYDVKVEIREYASGNVIGTATKNNVFF